MNTLDKARETLKARKDKSAMDKGITLYALELVDELQEAINGGYFAEENLSDLAAVRKKLLNGARDWHEYSYGGCALIYDGDICDRLFSPSVQKRTNHGEWNRWDGLMWLDHQAAALRKAERRVIKALRREVYK